MGRLLASRLKLVRSEGEGGAGGSSVRGWVERGIGGKRVLHTSEAQRVLRVNGGPYNRRAQTSRG